jgi:uncharacterized iron-regulated protein
VTPPVGEAQQMIDRWQRSDHPLAGRIVRNGRLLELPDLEQTLGTCRAYSVLALLGNAASAKPADWILGEVHDNAEHHAFRAALIRAAPWRFGAAVFEHIRADQREALERARSGPRSAEATLEALGWAQSGWPDGDMFAPLFAAVLSEKLTIVAGDPPRDLLRRVAREGADALPEAERARLGLDRPLPAEQHEALLSELAASHCGLMPRTAFTGLVMAQRYRDAHLAEAMLTAGESGRGVVLLTGNGHARKDRGVAWYLRLRAPERTVMVVQLIEVEVGRTNPVDYGLSAEAAAATADIIVFTPRPGRPDPCEAMRRQFGKGAK